MSKRYYSADFIFKNPKDLETSHPFTMESYFNLKTETVDVAMLNASHAMYTFIDGNKENNTPLSIDYNGAKNYYVEASLKTKSFFSAHEFKEFMNQFKAYSITPDISKQEQVITEILDKHIEDKKIIIIDLPVNQEKVFKFIDRTISMLEYLKKD